MSKSYDRNIERLKANVSQRSAEMQRINTEGAILRGKEGIERVRAVTEGLEPFSKELQEWKKRDIEKKKAEGVAAARKAKLDKAKWLEEHGSEAQKRLHAIEEAQKMGELAFEFEDAKAQDLEYQRLKKKLLESAGTSAYPDAERLAQLSPWQQVGFAQEKLRVFNETFEDKLAHEMQNSTKQFKLAGITFTPQEIRDNNMAFPMKQAAIELIAEDIRQQHGVDRFSPEMLKMSKTEDVILKAKESQVAKYRERYNIESSMNTRQKAMLEWQRSEKTAIDVEKLLVMNAATVDTDGDLLGNTGGWKAVEEILVSDGVKLQNPEYANKILDQPMSVEMARQLGVKPGTTFSQQWPQRTAEIRRKIKEGYVKEVDDEEKFLKAAGTELSNEFITEARKGDLSSQQVNEYKRKFGELGLTIPTSVSNYETASERDEREDKDQIEALMASQNGYISNEQLDAFHPKAALEHRKEATRLEEAALKKHGAEKKIKAHLDTAFTNMGIKGNEKSPAYVEAMENAKADYAQKYNRYIAMGYSSAEASHHALHAQQVTDKETGEMIPDSMGVLAEIRANGEGSKYVITGQAIEKELKPGHLRVARIRGAKQEILNDPNSVTTKVIGGDYGHRQITTIATNVEKHGRRGLYMDKGALQYYKGIARGRNARQGGWWGLVDAQLKAAGHKGLNPAERPKALELLTGEDANGNTIPDPRGSRAVDQRVSRAMNYPSQQTSLYAMNSLRDGQRFGRGTSVFDQPENLPIWYTGGVT
tara:strand:- start:103 stop:2388 length:2286 start_codon:yes stop_codon:yes gene_type:complete